MRLTLVEVLGQERADEMFDHRELVERVRWHLDEPRAEVFLAEDAGEIVGHTIVRVECEDGREIGLFSTTYVDPAVRRSGVASLLLAAGTQWMQDMELTEAATYTDSDNAKLIEFYRRHGYSLTLIDPEWARLHRRID